MGMEHRVKYFPISDLMCGYNIEKIEKLYDSQSFSIANINDAMEFYNFYLYFHDSNLSWKKWSKIQVEEFKKFSEELKSCACKYIASLNDSTFIDALKDIEFEYIDDLIYLLEKTSNFHNISESVIEEYLEQNKTFIYHALKNEHFVNHYGSVIKKFLIKNNSAEIIISSEDSKNNETVTRTFIPKCLSENERNTIIENYINSSEVNPNYLTLLISIPFEKKIPIPIIVDAENKLKQENEKLLSSAGRMCSFSLHFEQGQKTKAIITNKGNFSIDISYSLDWIYNNLTYDAILYNFVDMFGFVDGQYRIVNMNKSVNSGLMDSLSMLKNNKIYRKNFIFDFFEGLMNHELYAYRNILLSKGIYLEKMIETFFSEFLPATYNFPIITTHLSIDNKSYLEKCHELVTNIDIICKQFFHFAKYKKIDKALLQADNSPVKIENIPSLLKNKYVRGSGIDYQGITYAMFSNQCLLHYISSMKKQYECFYDLLQEQNVYKSDYPEYEHRTIDELVKWNLISVETDGHIVLKNKNRVLILLDLYRNEFLNFNRFDEDMKKEILTMKELKLIEFENTLLSQHESAYINYYLNETFPNGPKLRNKYAHGIEYLETDEDVHFNNYIILLRLLITLLLKINDDVYLFKSSSDNSNELE